MRIPRSARPTTLASPSSSAMSSASDPGAAFGSAEAEGCVVAAREVDAVVVVDDVVAAFGPVVAVTSAPAVSAAVASSSTVSTATPAGSTRSSSTSATCVMGAVRLLTNRLGTENTTAQDSKHTATTPATLATQSAAYPEEALDRGKTPTTPYDAPDATATPNATHAPRQYTLASALRSLVVSLASWAMRATSSNLAVRSARIVSACASAISVISQISARRERAASRAVTPNGALAPPRSS